MTVEWTTDLARPARYRVGCAGQFVLGMDSGYHDEDEAIVACLRGPLGCEVYDTQTKRWIGPTCMEEIDEARARLALRTTSAPTEATR